MTMEMISRMINEEFFILFYSINNQYIFIPTNTKFKIKKPRRFPKFHTLLLRGIATYQLAPLN